MRLSDRGEAIELTSQRRETLRWSRARLRSQSSDPEHYGCYRGMVIDQVLDRARKIRPSADQFFEQALVFAHVMRCQGRAECQAVQPQVAFRLLNGAGFFSDPGELVS